MLRAGELVSFLVPFAAFFAWWLLASGRGPSAVIVGAAFAGLLLLAGSLIWFGAEGALAPGRRYVPASVVGGRIVAGHAGASPAPP